jgi:hypothetical protein
MAREAPKKKQGFATSCHGDVNSSCKNCTCTTIILGANIRLVSRDHPLSDTTKNCAIRIDHERAASKLMIVTVMVEANLKVRLGLTGTVGTPSPKWLIMHHFQYTSSLYSTSSPHNKSH